MGFLGRKQGIEMRFLDGKKGFGGERVKMGFLDRKKGIFRRERRIKMGFLDGKKGFLVVEKRGKNGNFEQKKIFGRTRGKNGIFGWKKRVLVGERSKNEIFEGKEGSKEEIWMKKGIWGGKGVKMGFLGRKKGFLVVEKGVKMGILGRKRIFGGGKGG